MWISLINRVHWIRAFEAIISNLYSRIFVVKLWPQVFLAFDSACRASTLRLNIFTSRCSYFLITLHKKILYWSTQNSIYYKQNCFQQRIRILPYPISLFAKWQKYMLQDRFAFELKRSDLTESCLSKGRVEICVLIFCLC